MKKSSNLGLKQVKLNCVNQLDNPIAEEQIKFFYEISCELDSQEEKRILQEMATHTKCNEH